MASVFVSPASVDPTESGLTVVDVRREAAYAAGHVPGAVHVPFDQFRDPTDETAGKLPTAATFEALLSEAGIAPDDHIVAYDGDYGVYASRFFLTAEVFGHDPALLGVLDGDIERWARERETTTAVPETQTTDYACRRQTDGPLVSAAELEAALDGEAVIVDTRDPLEYDTVHLPGAVNLQWRDLVDEETRQRRPREQQARMLESHGIVSDRPVRLYCNTARRLSFVYTALQELEYDDVAVYEGGIAAWAEYGGPVETT
jgi:thiosulfate/3-mercaptopyruvate sulfurtransferase